MSIKAIAPAKVNLHLGIGAKREDGYHDVQTVMHALGLHDMLTLKVDFADKLVVRVGVHSHGGVKPLDIPQESNIVYKAALAMAGLLDREPLQQVTIVIDKEIPHGAGLGGGSSDAAATLALLCRLWNISIDDPRVVQLAGQLGADVAFFLYGGCALMDGKGETISRTLAPSKRQMVLVRPDEGVSTGAAYRTFDEAPVAIDPALTDNIRTAETADEVLLFNNLAPAAETLLPQLAEIRQWLAQQPGVTRGADGAPQVLLCGSGSTTFAFVDSFTDACRIVGAAKLQGWWARSTMLSPAKAAVLPGFFKDEPNDPPQI